MYFSQQFTWSAALNFHGAFLLQIKRGGAILLSTWTATTAHCKPLPEKWTAQRPVESSSAKFSPLAILFCRDYHRDACNNANDHYDQVCGERKRLKHIRTTCWVQNHEQEQHLGNSVDCPAAIAVVSLYSAEPSKH